MYRWILIFATLPAVAADDAVLAMQIRAQSDFDRVEAAAFPDLKDTMRCTQSQAVMLPVALPVDQPVLRFRKGWCELMGATLGPSRASYLQAAQDFAHAMAAYASRPGEPMPAGLQVLSAIARLKAGAEPHVMPDIRAGLESALATQACPAGLMPARLCQDLLSTARLWLGWLWLQEGDLTRAGTHLHGFPELGWSSWVAGRRALQAGGYIGAVSAIEEAVDAWTNATKYPRPGIVRLLGPKPDLPEAIAELGAARYLAGDPAGAIKTLDAAVKARPNDARSLFIRGLARDRMGQTEAALADYQIASRTAFAEADVKMASAQAHFYRGVWHFRRQAYPRAEDEFASSLNSAPAAPQRDDVTAWRHLAAVAGGACESSAVELGRSLGKVSPFFPRNEAEARLAACSPRNISSRN